MRFLDILAIPYDLFSIVPVSERVGNPGEDLSPGGPPAAGLLRFILNPFRALRGAMMASRYEVVNVHYLDVYQALIALGCRKTLIVTCMGSDVLQLLAHARGIFRRYLLLVLHNAAAITCNAESVQSVLVASGVPADKIHRVQWGTDQDDFRPLDGETRRSLRLSYGIPPDAKVFLSARSLTPFYRIHEIIRQFRLADRGSAFVLLVHAGAQVSTGYLQSCRAAAADAQNVIFHLGHLPADRLHELYNVADVSVHFPKSDAAPVSMLESFACGTGVLGDIFVPTYKEVAGRYAITLVDLSLLSHQDLDRALEISARSRELNRRALVTQDSKEVSVRLIERLLKSLSYEWRPAASRRAANAEVKEAK